MQEDQEPGRFTTIQTVTGLPEDIEGDEGSYGFGLPAPARGHQEENFPEVSFQSDDPSMNISTLQKALEAKPVNRDLTDPPAKTVENSGSLRLPGRRWRPPKGPRSGQRKVGAKPGNDGNDSEDEESSSADGSDKGRPGNPTSDPYKMIHPSAPWNKESILYCNLVWSLGVPESFMVVLQDRMRIANTESFLEFFKDPPSLFLDRVPLSVEEVYRYKDYWYMASLMANYFVYHLHSGEIIQEYSRTYDDKTSISFQEYHQLLFGISDYLDLYVPAARTEFDAQFTAALDRLRGMAPKQSSFRHFNARIGQTIPTTPPAPAPVDIFDSQRSPIVYPMNKPGTFVNVPPYARKGIHFEPRENGKRPSESPFPPDPYRLRMSDSATHFPIVSKYSSSGPQIAGVPDDPSDSRPIGDQTGGPSSDDDNPTIHRASFRNQFQ